MLKTVNITDAGQIDSAPIDSLVFDATQCTGSAYITYINQSYYSIVYERYWYTGFGSTVTIETRCLIAPNGFSAFASGRFQINLVWTDDSDADSTRVEWCNSPDDSWGCL